MSIAISAGFITTGLLLQGCSSSSSGIGYSSETVLASPFVSTSGSSAVVVDRKLYASDRAARAEEVGDLLGATSADSCSFAIDLSKAGVHAACYGPKVNYYSHPEWTSGNPPQNGQLPTGDLGIWNSTTTTSSTEACTAGEITSLVDNLGKYAHTANLVGASLYCFVKNTTDLTLPAAGETVTLSGDQLTDFSFGTTDPVTDRMTVTSASITGADSLGNVLRTFTVEGSLFDKESNKTMTIRVVNKHVDTGSNSFKAHVSYEFTDTTENLNRGDCSPSNGTTFAGHQIVNKNSASSLVQEFQSAEFCGGASPVDSTTLQISGADELSGSNTDGWGNNYSFALFSFDPRSAEDTYLEGSYAYAWTAGHGDSYSRVFNVSIDVADDGAKTGTGVFGYGKKPAEAGADFGKIQGMICNWAAPGNTVPRTMVDKVQRQRMTYDATDKIWEVGSAEDIVYAPTNTCGLTSDTFRYLAVSSGNAGDDSAALSFTSDRAAASATDLTADLFDISSDKNSDGFYIPFSAFPSRPTL